MIILMFPALILGVLCLTRAWYGDWKTAIVCFVLALGCVILVYMDAGAVHARRRAMETRRRQTEQMQQQQAPQNGASNQASEVIGAPGALQPQR